MVVWIPTNDPRSLFVWQVLPSINCPTVPRTFHPPHVVSFPAPPWGDTVEADALATVSQTAVSLPNLILQIFKMSGLFATDIPRPSEILLNFDLISAKHYLDDPTQAVLSSLRAATLTNPSLLFDETNKIVYRHPASLTDHQNVSVVSGGGSGHEPGWASTVGRGALSACVAGTIFASPGAQQVRACLLHRLPADSQGALCVVTNYTGDVLNFGVGVEKARALGKKVEMVVVGDDVGVGRAKSGKVGRRGLSGTALVIKVCGALAEMGESLDECARVGRLAADNLVSLGASLSRVHQPGRALQEAKEEEERLGPGLVEIGMGVHNEPGCEKVRTNLPGLVKTMLAQMLDPSDKDRAYVNIDPSDQTVLLINNFGGTSNLELGGIVSEVMTQLKETYGLKPRRIIAGTFFGSLNGPGFIISVLKLTDTGLEPGKSMLDLLDAPAEANGWSTAIKKETWEKNYEVTKENAETGENEIKQSNLKGVFYVNSQNLKTTANMRTVNPEVWKSALKSGLKRVIAAESEVTRFDTIVGDGDCGIGLKRGGEAIQEMLETSTISDDVLVDLTKIIQIVETTMDGTSGAIYAIFLNALAASLRNLDHLAPTLVTAKIWAEALEMSLNALSKYTPAQPGDRTLMDALFSFVDVLKRTEDTEKAAAAAKKGADGTKGMKASLGRTVYVGGAGFKEVPDPGAYGLSEFLTGLAEGL